MYYKTADLCDINQDKNIQVLSPIFKSYGGIKYFYGEIITIKLNKSNWDLLSTLRDVDGKGKIIIVDVDEAYFGVVGDRLLSFAERNNYTAIIINGYVRDIKETKKINVGLYALGTCPLRNFEQNEGEKDIELKFGGVTFNNGYFIYADEDGIIISSKKLDTTNLSICY